MKSFKKAIAVGAMVLAIGATSITAFATSIYRTPAEAVAKLTGRTVESVIAEKAETGKTYGTIAAEAGKLDEYKADNLEMKKDNLNTQVAAGTITQEKADAIIKAIEENQATCDGTGTAKSGQSLGAKFGSNGTCQGTEGANRGTGTGGRRMGNMGLQHGSCYAPAN